MSKSQLNIRIDDELSGALDKRTESTGKTKTAIVSEALASYLNVSTDKSDVDMLRERLEALERKFQDLKEDEEFKDISFKKSNKQRKVKNQDKVKNRPYSDNLITLEEGAELTGYTKSTFTRKKSEAEIQRVDSYKGRALYDRNEVLEKVGTK